MYWDEFEVQVYMNYVDYVMDNYMLCDFDLVSMMLMVMVFDVVCCINGGCIVGIWCWDDVLQLVVGIDGLINVYIVCNGGEFGSVIDYYFNLCQCDVCMVDVGVFGELCWIFIKCQWLIGGVWLDCVQVCGYGLFIVVGGGGMDMGGGMDGGMGMSGMGMSGGMNIVIVDVSCFFILFFGFVCYECDFVVLLVMFYVGIGYVECFFDYWELFGQYVDVLLLGFCQFDLEKIIQLDIGVQYYDVCMKVWIFGYVGVVQDFILMYYLMSVMGIGIVSNVCVCIVGGEMGVSYVFDDYWSGDVMFSIVWGENCSEY